jgi:hypothetical protein
MVMQEALETGVRWTLSGQTLRRKLSETTEDGLGAKLSLATIKTVDGLALSEHRHIRMLSRVNKPISNLRHIIH